MSAEEVTTPSCQATETFHSHCGHTITTFTHHSDLCPALHPQLRNIKCWFTASTLSSAFRGMGQTLGKLARRLTLRSSQPQQAQITSHEFTFTARVSCPQVLFQPFCQSYPCPPCAKALGMGPGDLDKIFAGSEEERWQQRNKMLKAKADEWAAKMGE
ncbi:hypothetical protein BPAE_0006g01080 [Botrytis paeoniae]|uniref:Uncharacterized protein n=1 Tax=Botrytis paeoniae TaxID=278948 RepID=A0A4Z1G3N8_9HELO|nr:hypothetical protein BPAE_0006g01080 [Botrytis paeoniae]